MIRTFTRYKTRHCERPSGARQSISHITLDCFVITFLAMTVLVPTTAHAQDITTGLIGHWRLDETSGTTATDSAGSNNATMQSGLDATNDSTNGAVWTALTFDGTDDYISVANTFGLTGDASVSAWFRKDGDGVDNTPHIFNFYTNASDEWGVSITNSNGNLSIQDDIDGVANNNLYTTPTTTGQWHHVVAVLDSLENKLYLDGVLIGSGTSTINTIDSIGNTFYIGSKRGNWQFFEGLIDDVRIYDRALSAEDIEALYEAKAPGTLRFNNSWDAIEYHDGYQWIAAGPPKYKPNAVTFDGSTDIDTTAVFGADSKTMTGSFWIKRNGNLGTDNIILSRVSARYRITLNASNVLEITGNNSSGTAILNMEGSTAITDSNWHHVLFSFDLSNTSNRHMYIDDTAEIFTVTTYTDDTLHLSNTTAIGATLTSSNYYIGDMADFWMNTEYVDLSIEENRRAFIDVNGNPVDLGADGSKPTGTAPDIFLSGDTVDWHTNKGTGGGFTENGSLSTASYGPAEPNITTGLVGHWTLDEDSGSTVYDRSGNGLDGTIGTLTLPAASTTGKIGQSIDFNADPEHIDLGSSATLNPNDITIATWVKPDGTWNGTIVRAGSTRYIMDIEAASPDSFRCYGGNGNLLIQYPTTSFPFDKWYHIACTFTNNEGKLYVNGTELGSDTSGTYPAGTFGDVYIGNRPSTINRHFDGEIDDVRIYNRVLSQKEIRALYGTTGMCSSPANPGGTIIYESANDQMQYCDGENWVPMGPAGDGGISCSNPSGDAGDITYNTTYNIMQYCEGDTWIPIGRSADPCDASLSPSVGQTCRDGSIYAGLSTDGNVPMFTTPEDAPTTMTWNDGNTNYSDTTALDLDDGDGNTTIIIATDSDSVTAGTQTHDAAQYCNDLVAHGHADWYLPAINELGVLYSGHVAIGNFDRSGAAWSGFYYSSSDRANTSDVSSQNFSDGVVNNTHNKHFLKSVRCVRKD